jgi:hypothetical protein
VTHKVESYTLIRFEDDRAWLDDEAGESICIPKHWLPKEAELGVSFSTVSVTGYIVSSLSFEVPMHADPYSQMNAGDE